MDRVNKKSNIKNDSKKIDSDEFSKNKKKILNKKIIILIFIIIGIILIFLILGFINLELEFIDIPFPFYKKLIHWNWMNKKDLVIYLAENTKDPNYQNRKNPCILFDQKGHLKLYYQSFNSANNSEIVSHKIWLNSFNLKSNKILSTDIAIKRQVENSNINNIGIIKGPVSYIISNEFLYLNDWKERNALGDLLSFTTCLKSSENNPIRMFPKTYIFDQKIILVYIPNTEGTVFKGRMYLPCFLSMENKNYIPGLSHTTYPDVSNWQITKGLPNFLNCILYSNQTKMFVIGTDVLPNQIKKFKIYSSLDTLIWTEVQTVFSDAYGITPSFAEINFRDKKIYFYAQVETLDSINIYKSDNGETWSRFISIKTLENVSDSIHLIYNNSDTKPTLVLTYVNSSKKIVYHEITRILKYFI